jgi:hypothetical protein
MHVLRRASVAAIAVASGCLVYAAAGLAGTSSVSGSVPNGGCDGARPVSVGGPSRIEVEVSSTSADNTVVGEIVAPNGNVVATGSYDTPGGGDYSIRVCSLGSSLDPPQLQYSGLIGTGPAGRVVLQGAAQPQPSTGGVLGATTTLKVASGKGAIMTRAGLAWFTLSTTNASATLRVYDPMRHTTRLMKGLHAAYGSSSVTLTGSGVKFVLVRAGGKSQITYRSSGFKAGGKVVRGTFHLVV